MNRGWLYLLFDLEDIVGQRSKLLAIGVSCGLTDNVTVVAWEWTVIAQSCLRSYPDNSLPHIKVLRPLEHGVDQLGLGPIMLVTVSYCCLYPRARAYLGRASFLSYQLLYNPERFSASRGLHAVTFEDCEDFAAYMKGFPKARCVLLWR